MTTIPTATETEERLVEVNGVTLAYHIFGDPAGAPLVLIAGLGMQLISWDVSFCRRLAARGFYVVRYDQRDVGHATHYDQAGIPQLVDLMQAWMLGRMETLSLPYTLPDLADDAAGLLTVLDLAPAHVLGASMGGMVAQLLALRHPHILQTLVCLSSSTLDSPDMLPRPDTLMKMFAPPPSSREAYVEQALRLNKLLHGSVLPHDAERTRRRAAEAFDRGLYPAGTARQLAAVVAAVGWKKELPAVRVPTLVIHGDQDPLLLPAGGRDIAATIPHAQYREISGMGHTMPPVIWPEIIAQVTQFCRPHFSEKQDEAITA